MKISIFLVLLLLVPLACYGQNSTQTQAFMQIEVRDSNGILTAYTEGKPVIFLADNVIKFVEPKSEKSIILLDGQKFEKIQYTTMDHYSKAHVMSGWYIVVPINGQNVYAFYFDHDGYPVFPGDSATIFLTILRPLS